MKQKFPYFVFGFTLCVIAFSVMAAVFKVQVVANSSGQVFFNQGVICSNAFMIRTNFVMLDTVRGGSFLISVTNGVLGTATNTSNIGL